jgi:hypothetical protein
MKKIISLCLLMLAFIINAQAQAKLEIDNVIKITLRKSGPIIQNNDVKGYYFFFQSDKIDRKTNEYTLKLTDQNLNNAKDIKFQDSKDVILVESSYDGDGLMFTFYDRKAKTLENRLYGMDGKQINTYTRDLDKRSQQMIEEFYSLGGEQSENKGLFGIQNQGFLSLYPIRDGKKNLYEINFYSTQTKKQWTYTPADDDEKREFAQFIGATDSIAFFEVLKFERKMSKNSTSFLTGYYLNSGKMAFEIPTIDKNYQLYPMNLAKREASNNIILMGPYYNSDDRVMADKTLGMAIWEINSSGKIINTKYNSWETDFGKYLSINDKGKIDDIGYLYIHKILQTSDGNFYAVGEGYKKTASALGIAMNILSQSYSNSVTKVTVTNFVMLKFDSKFNVTGATIYEKNKNLIELPGTAADMNSGPSLAVYIKYTGGFDYAYTQTNKDISSFVVGYTDYVKSDDYKGMTFNSISYNDGAITRDKIDLKSKASNTAILPAKFGNVLVLDYYKKDKKLDIHMEKLN